MNESMAPGERSESNRGIPQLGGCVVRLGRRDKAHVAVLRVVIGLFEIQTRVSGVPALS